MSNVGSVMQYIIKRNIKLPLGAKYYEVNNRFLFQCRERGKAVSYVVYITKDTEDNTGYYVYAIEIPRYPLILSDETYILNLIKDGIKEFIYRSNKGTLNTIGRNTSDRNLREGDNLGKGKIS